MHVIYNHDSVIGRVALPTRRQFVLEAPAVFETQIESDEDGQPILDPATGEPVTAEVEISPAAYREETTEEMVARMIAAGHMPGLPWSNHIILPDDHPAASAPVGLILPGDWSGPDQVSVSPGQDLATAADIADAKTRVAQMADELALVVTGPVPETERVSWPTKEIAARAYLDGVATAQQTAMLQAEADLTGETLSDLSGKILANADAYLAIAGMIAGFRRQVMATLDALPAGTTTRTDVETVMTTAKAQADALLAAVMS